MAKELDNWLADCLVKQGPHSGKISAKAVVKKWLAENGDFKGTAKEIQAEVQKFVGKRVTIKEEHVAQARSSKTKGKSNSDVEKLVNFTRNKLNLSIEDMIKKTEKLDICYLSIFVDRLGGPENALQALESMRQENKEEFSLGW